MNRLMAELSPETRSPEPEPTTIHPLVLELAQQRKARWRRAANLGRITKAPAELAPSVESGPEPEGPSGEKTAEEGTKRVGNPGCDDRRRTLTQKRVGCRPAKRSKSKSPSPSAAATANREIQDLMNQRANERARRMTCSFRQGDDAWWVPGQRESRRRSTAKVIGPAEGWLAAVGLPASTFGLNALQAYYQEDGVVKVSSTSDAEGSEDPDRYAAAEQIFEDCHRLGASVVRHPGRHDLT